MRHPLLLPFLFGAGLLAGCSSTNSTHSDAPVRVDPTVVQTSYDYSKPADIQRQSRPVYVLPHTVQYWKAAKVDEEGNWVGGHYEATIIQPGHWATLEEAELSGQPYLLAGDSRAIVPVPSSKPGQSIGEIDILAMQQRLATLEETLKNQPKGGMSQEEAAEVSAAVRAVADKVSANSETITSGVEDRRTYVPQVSVNAAPDGKDNGTGAAPPPLSESVPNGSTVVLPARNNENSMSAYEVNAGGGARIRVHYLSDKDVEITYKGKVYQVKLKNPNDQIRLRVR